MLSVPLWQSKGTLHVPQGPCIRVTSHVYGGWRPQHELLGGTQMLEHSSAW